MIQFHGATWNKPDDEFAFQRVGNRPYLVEPAKAAAPFDLLNRYVIDASLLGQLLLRQAKRQTVIFNQLGNGHPVN